MPFVDDLNRILRDHEGYTGDGHGGNGALPVGDRSTARKPISKRDLRLLLGQVGVELESVMGGVYPAAGVAPATSFATATDTAGALYLLIDGRLYEHDFAGEFESADGRRWKPSTPESNASTPILVLATGQSNMLGGSGQTGGERRTINGQVYVWEQFPTRPGQTVGWKVAGPDSDDWPFMTTGNSIAYHFCDMLQRQTGRPVYLVMHAVGGQPIAEWLPGGGAVPGATGALWVALNGSLNGARASTLPTGGTMASHGIEAADIMLWHQGEADADYKGTSAESYLARFRKMIRLFRDPPSEGSSAAPLIKNHAPVIAGELLHGGTSGGNPTDDRNAELATLGREDPLVALASSRNLRSDDNLHFIGADLQEFARRYFDQLGRFPKRSLEAVDMSIGLMRHGIRAVTAWGNGVAIAGGATATITLPVEMSNANYVPSVVLTAHGNPTPYPPILKNKTTTTFDLENTGAHSMTVSWALTYFSDVEE